jgi:hypothetical protein
LKELGVGYEFGEIKASLLDHPKVSDALESVSRNIILKSVVNRWWWCGVGVRFNGLFVLGDGFGFLRCLGFAFVSCFHHC